LRGHRIALLATIVLLLAGSGLTGYMLARDEPRLRAEPSPTAAAVAEAGGARIAADATVRWEYVYEMCSHTVTVEAPVDEELVGLTFTELQEQYPEAYIVEFSSEEVVLRQSFACYCPEHYILKKKDDELAIYRTKLGSDEQYVYRLIHLPFDSIEAGERTVLTVGRVFDTLQDAESYIDEVLEGSTP